MCNFKSFFFDALINTVQMRTEVFSVSRNWTTLGQVFCEISLVHNATFVDLNQSDIECTFSPLNSTFGWNAGDNLESRTGYVFFVAYGGEAKNGMMDSRILRAGISKTSVKI